MQYNKTKYPNNIRTVNGAPQLFEDDVVLMCDTSTGPVTINLLEIPDNYWSTQWRLYVCDASSNASTNNITIIAGTGQLINGSASVVINADNGSCVVQIVNNKMFVATGAVSSGSNSCCADILKYWGYGDGEVQITQADFANWTPLTVSAAAYLACEYTTTIAGGRFKITIDLGCVNEDTILGGNRCDIGISLNGVVGTTAFDQYTVFPDFNSKTFHFIVDIKPGTVTVIKPVFKHTGAPTNIVGVDGLKIIYEKYPL